MTEPSALDSVRAFASAYVVPAALRLAIAILVFVIGRAVARILLRATDRVMERGKVDVSLRKFLGSVLYALMFLAIALAALDTVGVRTTALVAVIGAAGITIGLALQGSLSNFAAGVVLIVFRPYKVADLVSIGKYTGKIDAIKAFNTVLVTLDHREVTVPNAIVLTGPVENLTVLGRRRLDLLVTIDGDRDLAAWRTLLAAVAAADPRVHPDPAVVVDVAEVTATATRLRVRAWTTADAYAAVGAHALDAMRTALLAEKATFAIAIDSPPA